ncbi:MAG: hypothetical protein PHY05_06745 [Methanothrix sp.]|nr:hypothetical protein [Methanothrix sp.]
MQRSHPPPWRSPPLDEGNRGYPKIRQCRSFAHSLVKEFFDSNVVAISDSKGGAFNAACIEADMAARVKAKVIIELANGPTNPEADAILFRNKVHVIPDFPANVGRVTVSYFEMVQNIMRGCWFLEEVYHKLDERMTMAYWDALAASPKKYNINMRQAAYTAAVVRATDHLDFSDFQ